MGENIAQIYNVIEIRGAHGPIFRSSPARPVKETPRLGQLT